MYRAVFALALLSACGTASEATTETTTSSPESASNGGEAAPCTQLDPWAASGSSPCTEATTGTASSDSTSAQPVLDPFAPSR